MKFLKSAVGVSFASCLVVILSIARVGNTASAQSLTTLVSFNGSNGAAPYYGNLTSDANGDLFGTTEAGGANGVGTVFEIALTASGYATAPATLVSFTGTDGAYPLSGLITDANGNLFGTTEAGGANGYGTVFEILKSGSGYASAPTTLVSFDDNDGAFPQSSLIIDSKGNLFGTTFLGGAAGAGTAYEIVNSGSSYASTPTTLVSFDGADGSEPVAGLVADSNGDLFGTTASGGESGAGTAFEIVSTTSGYDTAPVTLVSFNGADGTNPYSGLIIDAGGNLLGTTNSGGAYGYGTVFEIVNTSGVYSSTPTTLVNFDDNDGAYPVATLIADANGNLFGTTTGSGASGNGTIFEIANSTSGYATTPTTLISFNGADGAVPYSGLIADANGNLFGTTLVGGASGDGTVYEVTGSGFVPPKQFVGTPGTPHCVGDSISNLAHTYGGVAHAAASLGYATVADLQSAVSSYCSQ
ncbi:MAG TPA: choice-of-anchor tandem repeat GloVer-containing protein [Terracidiphilus sp.]|nr:choice-of-anchor tandem repeat GloVer-containing protein [Terracidiphilus sp.]